MTMQVASVLGRIRQACHYEYLVVGDTTKRPVLSMRLVAVKELRDVCVDYPG